MSWKPEVKVMNNNGQWSQNNLAFATEAEELESARDLFNRWILVEEFRAVESDQPVNYAIIDGKLQEVKA